MRFKDEHCSYCGSNFENNKQFVDNTNYPKQCVACGNITYKNPIPVVVTMVGSLVGKELKASFLVVKRKHDPQKDRWAFPGGFLECNESWQEGSARELFEETGIKISPNELSFHDMFTASNGNLIIFSFCWGEDNLDITKFIPNEEVSELKLISEIEELAFPTHTEVLKRFL